MREKYSDNINKTVLGASPQEPKAGAQVIWDRTVGQLCDFGPVT